jgi:tRNA threonylcarbamoyladenosine biosynthesis protein TsaB
MMSDPARRILAIETSGRTSSTALAAGDGRILASAGPLAAMKHASELMPAIARLLHEQAWAPDSVSDVFISHGPGSFTGLRIGVSIARTLAWSIGTRITAVPTMDCLAWNALSAVPLPAHLAVLIDAKGGRAFCAAFDLTERGYAKLAAVQLAEPARFLARCRRPLAVLGEGVPHHRQVILDSGAIVLDAELWTARADNLVRAGLPLADAGQHTPPGDLIPLYIRRPDPEEKWEKRLAGGT